jgi:mRNA-degrading endonuclease toxin of MazEF toxin-antitoxin module
MIRQAPLRGHLYLVTLDKPRLALIVSVDARNSNASDVLVIPCSTVLSHAPTHVRLRKGEGGLPHASVLKCEQITTIDKSDLRRGPLGGPLPARVVARTERAVMRAIGIPVPDLD